VLAPARYRVGERNGGHGSNSYNNEGAVWVCGMGEPGVGRRGGGCCGPEEPADNMLVDDSASTMTGQILALTMATGAQHAARSRAIEIRRMTDFYNTCVVPQGDGRQKRSAVAADLGGEMADAATPNRRMLEDQMVEAESLRRLAATGGGGPSVALANTP
jgi:hypothetical protein